MATREEMRKVNPLRSLKRLLTPTMSVVGQFTAGSLVQLGSVAFKYSTEILFKHQNRRYLLHNTALAATLDC